MAKLNETWGDNVNVVAAARAVNFIIDYVDTDQITHMRITNSTNSKESADTTVVEEPNQDGAGIHG